MPVPTHLASALILEVSDTPAHAMETRDDHVAVEHYAILATQLCRLLSSAAAKPRLECNVLQGDIMRASDNGESDSETMLGTKCDGMTNGQVYPTC